MKLIVVFLIGCVGLSTCIPYHVYDDVTSDEEGSYEEPQGDFSNFQGMVPNSQSKLFDSKGFEEFLKAPLPSAIDHYKNGFGKEGSYQVDGMDVSDDEYHAAQGGFQPNLPVAKYRLLDLDNGSEEKEEIDSSEINREPRFVSFLRQPLSGDYYNPEYIINPSIAIARRNWRLRHRRRPEVWNPYAKYTLSQQGAWGNPKEYDVNPHSGDTYYGGHYLGNHY